MSTENPCASLSAPTSGSSADWGTSCTTRHERQTVCAWGGEVVEWFGAEDSDAPASVTRIGEPDSAAGWIAWIAIGAVVLAVVALGLALRPSDSRTGAKGDAVTVP